MTSENELRLLAKSDKSCLINGANIHRLDLKQLGGGGGEDAGGRNGYLYTNDEILDT